MKNAHVTGKDAAKTYMQQALEFSKAFSQELVKGLPKRPGSGSVP
jgi:hypothetical protein